MKAEDLKGMNGRKVLVEGRINDDRPGYGVGSFVRIDGHTDCVSVPHSAIREILPQEIKVGDRVTCEGYTGRVLHVDGPFAWLRTRLDENLVVRCDICTLIEPAQ
jgi:hypothetical protein